MIFHSNDKNFLIYICTLLLIIIPMAFTPDCIYAEENDVIYISTSQQLCSIGVSDDMPLNGNYMLTCDIDMKDINFTPIGSSDSPFTGTFDGDGHTISNLTISGKDLGVFSDSSIYGFGLFGVLGSHDSLSSACVSNLVILSSSIEAVSKSNTAAGFISAVITDHASIDNIAVINSNISLKGQSKGTLSGAGTIAGCALQTEDSQSNKYINISDIYTNADIKATGFNGENTLSGILGCVYKSRINSFSCIVSLGTLSYNDESGYGISTSLKYDGNGIAKLSKRCYFSSDDNRKENGIGSSLNSGVLASEKVALSDKWLKTNGVYPVLAIASDKSADDIMCRFNPVLKRNRTNSNVCEDFYVAAEYMGTPLVWTSSENFVSIDADTGLVTVNHDCREKKKFSLTCSYGEKSKTFNFTTDGDNTIKFDKTYVLPGETLTVLNAPEGAKFNWTIHNMVTGKKTSIKDDTTGKYTVTENDLEAMISVTVNNKTTLNIYVSTLPVIYIDSKTEYSNIKKTKYYDASINVCGNESSYTDMDFYNGHINIKGRGHSSSYYKKLPFKIKLDSKTDLLGVSGYESKHWVLLCNILDHTFTRNQLMYEFAYGIGASEKIDSVNTVLIFNGEYKGIYQLCESIRIEEGRTDIFDYDEYAEYIAETIADNLIDAGKLASHFREEFTEDLKLIMENDYSYIDNRYIEYEGAKYTFSDYGIKEINTNGGYMAVMDFYSRKLANQLATMTTAYTLPLYFDSPDTDTSSTLKSLLNSSLYEFAVKYNQSFEYALHSDDFFFNNDDTHYKVTDTGTYTGGKWSGTVFKEVEYSDDENNGKHYSQMFDMDSLVQNFLMCEFSLNFDSMKNSFYYHKDIDNLAKFGPFWDYDWAMGNLSTTGFTNLTSKWQTTTNGFTFEHYYQYVSWNRMLIRDPYFLLKVYEKYKEIRPSVIEDIIKEGGFIDTSYEQLKYAALADDRCWKYVGMFTSFEKSMQDLYSYMDRRVTWLDEQFKDFDTLVSSLKYYRTSDYLSVSSVTKNSDNSYTITAEAYDDSVKTIAFQINGTYIVTAPVENGIAAITVPADIFNTDSSGSNIVEIKAIDIDGNYIVNSKYSQTGNYNLIHSNYYVFE